MAETTTFRTDDSSTADHDCCDESMAGAPGAPVRVGNRFRTGGRFRPCSACCVRDLRFQLAALKHGAHRAVQALARGDDNEAWQALIEAFDATDDPLWFGGE